MKSGVANQIRHLLGEFSVIFWDFDGVIKESVTVKSDAFERLFLPYGREVAARVRRHHEENGGVSRYEKIPLYLEWAGEAVTEERIEDFCRRFSELALRGVIDAPWVPGVREYLLDHHVSRKFVLVTATPAGEIRLILDELEMADCFIEVHGAPVPKSAAIRDVLHRLDCGREDALSVGDSETDLDAAMANGIAFLLRRTNLNGDLQKRFDGPAFDGLNHG